MQQRSSPSKSQGRTGFSQTGTAKPVQPEDNWELVGNPDVYLDQLPQPFKFINKCFDMLIMKPVFNQITLIEDKKKTTEYEGYLKEVMATGFMEHEGITTMNQTQVAVGAGGLLDKENYSNGKVLIGDKFGAVHLFDVGRKLILDKKGLFEGQQVRRILGISSATVVWMETKLTYSAVLARGSPIVKILAFKHNENKLHLLYTINVCPHLANPDNLEANPDQSYLELPSEAKFSLDCLFLSITSFNGEVKLIKMPAIINPLRDEDVPVQQPPSTLQTGAKGQPTPPPQQHTLATGQQHTSSMNALADVVLKNEIDNIPTQNLDLSAILIAKIDGRKEQKFKDPFAYNPNQEAPTPVPVQQQPPTTSSKDKDKDQAQQVPVEQPKPEPPLHERHLPQYSFKYHLGPRHIDQEGGDAGTLLKKSKFSPQVFFIRSAFCGKSNQPSVSTESSSKFAKQYFITTGVVIAYLGTFDVIVYNIQKPLKENVPWDYSVDYFNKLILQRKLNSKKKVEKNLASLIKTARQKEEATERSKQSSLVAQEFQQMKESLSKPVRSFKMPYYITCVGYQGTEENFQGLAVGLVDGAVILIDLILGIERKFLEKHPAEITSLAFYEDKVLMSGSVDGRINLNDLEDETDNSKIYRCQNCQDRRIPVAKVMTSSDFGIGVGVDIEGNCRFYDLLRFRKIAKLCSYNQREVGSDPRFLQGINKCKWRMVPNVAFEISQDAFLAITQVPNVPLGESHKVEGEEVDLQARKFLSEKDLLIMNKYSDKRENLKTLNAIIRDTPEVPYYLQKSTLCIFRFEDVILNIFPHLASLKRKGMTIKEIFLKQDPQKEQPGLIQLQQIPNQQNSRPGEQTGYENNSLRSQVDSKKNIANKSVLSGHSNKKSEHYQVNFNLGLQGGQSPSSPGKQEYDIPTLKRLNPELYKEYAKSQKQMKDPAFQSVQHIKERYGYHEMRLQRIQKRTEEVAKELEAKNQEQILKTRQKNMGSSQK